MCSQKTRHTKDSFNSSYSCSQEKSRVLQSLPAQAWNIRVIRVIRVHKKNPVSCSPFPRKRGTFVLFELFVFKRRISCPPVLSRASVEHSCYSSYSCSKEESRVHKKNPVFCSPFPRKRGTFVLFEFTRKIPCSQENYPCSHPHAKIIKKH